MTRFHLSRTKFSKISVSTMHLLIAFLLVFAGNFTIAQQAPSSEVAKLPQGATAELKAEPADADLVLNASPLPDELRVSKLELSHVWSFFGRPQPRYLHYPNVRALSGLGFDGLDAYVHWSEMEPVSRNEAKRFFIADAEIELATMCQLRTGLTVLASPFRSFPDWFLNNPQARFFTSLDNRQETPILSFWNPSLTGHIDRLIGEVSGHYGDALDLLILGPSGSYGDASYPAGGGWYMPRNYNQGLKWWCDQPEARQEFRDWLEKKYGGADGVCDAWVCSATGIESFANAPHNLVSLPGEPGYDQYFQDATGLPVKFQRRFQDFTTWYANALENHVEFWLERARIHRPEGRIAVFMAGEGHPMTGVNFSRLIKLASKYDAEVRFAAPTQNPGRLSAILSQVSAAAAYYKVPLTLDAAGANVPSGLTTFFNMAAMVNAHGLVIDAIFRGSDEAALKDAKQAIEIIKQHLTSVPSAETEVEVAVLLPESALALDHRLLADWQITTARLRDVLDLHVLNEVLIQEGGLKEYRFLLSPPLARADDESLKKILEFVDQGGVWIADRSAVTDSIIQEYDQKAENGCQNRGKGFISLLQTATSENPGGAGRFAPETAQLLQCETRWSSPDTFSLNTDGVFVTKRVDGSWLLWNTLSRKITVKVPEALAETKQIELQPAELKVLNGKKE